MEYYNSVIAAKELGVMYASGYNMFYPDREITGNEAVTALIRALSYEKYALTLGAYPTGYLLAGKYINLTDGISDFNGKLTEEAAALLLYNALNADTMSVDYIENGNIALKKNEGVNILKDIMTVYRYDAVLINDGAVSFDNSGIMQDENMVILRLVSNGNEIITYASVVI